MSQNDEHLKDVLDTLSTLAPTAIDSPHPASLALARLHNELESPVQVKGLWRWTQMFRQKSVLVTMLMLVIFVIALSFPGVRAAASDFLGLFRVQKFAAISIAPEQLALLEEIAESGLFPGEIEMIDPPGEPQLAGSLTEAESVLNWKARTPEQMGEPDMVYTMEGGSGRLIVDVDNARAILEIAGADSTLIPDSLDGAPVDVTIFSGLSQNWNEGIVLVQAPSPLVEYPDDVDPSALGEALLQALGMDEVAASLLADSIDWTTTLLLPIPENVASFSEVSVDGQVGLALSSISGNNAGILWQRDGSVYALSGSNIDELIDVANTLR